MDRRKAWLTGWLVLLAPLGVVRGEDLWLSRQRLFGHSTTSAASTTDLWHSADALTGRDNADATQRMFDRLTPALAQQLADSPGQPIQLVQGSSAASGEGGDSGGGGGDLAAKSQNPVSDLVSLPLQNNWDFGIGPGDDQRYIGNLQPVVPVKLNEDWNLINRVILPFVNSPAGPGMTDHGIGDMVGQFFLSPRDVDSFIWGVGPAVLFPTASSPHLGFQEWGVGVSGVALISEGPIVTGALVSQIWSVEGSTQPFLVQPFFNYNLPEGWFLNASGECNADWALPEDSRWSFPLGGGVGRVFPILGQPVNILARFAPYLLKPDGGPDWQFRLQVVLLFPKAA